MSAIEQGWDPIRLDSSIQAGPTTVVPAPLLGAPLLPLELMSWEDFERLQWRILRDVEGLRHARLYGRRGQAQHGLDVVALATTHTGVALQSKRYLKFDESDLDAAVAKFRETSRPFEVQRLVIGVACEAKSTAIDEALAKHRTSLNPVELELWDKDELSAKLRGQPELVIQFFGQPTAEAFCLPFVFKATEVPSADAVVVREALARTPEVSTGAAQCFRDARSNESDPRKALELIEAGQARLVSAGFRSFAAQYEEHRFRVLAQLGRSAESARGALNEMWLALDRGKIHSAERTIRRLEQIAADESGSEVANACLSVAHAAISLHVNPLGQVPAFDSLALGDLESRARLAILAGEIALSNDLDSWLEEAAQDMGDIASELEADGLLRTRLRLLVAEATQDWSHILADARKLRLGHDSGALVTARYARHRALRQHFEEADTLWEEAAGDACLASRWCDASTWVFSRRAFRTHWKLGQPDELLSLEIALGEMGPSESVIPIDEQAYTNALDYIHRQKMRPAAIAAQRALRQTVVLSDWGGEQRARRVLGHIYAASEEPELAASHYCRAGDTAAVKELARQFPTKFIDVTSSLAATNYWTVGTSFRLIAAEADLVPDLAIDRLAELILDELRGAEQRTLADFRGLATSRYLGALKALAGVAGRLTTEQADTALTHFESQPEVEQNHYRFHDQDEAMAVANIAISQPSLRSRAITHLVQLLARSEPSRKDITMRAIDSAPEIAKAPLEIAAHKGNMWAQETLAARGMANASPSACADALDRLARPLQHTPGLYTVGTNAIGDSVLVRALPPEQRQAAVTELLQRADDPHVGLADRGEYLLAASNLLDDMSADARHATFTEAMRLVNGMSPSAHDQFEAQHSSKLGMIRHTGSPSSPQAKALFLAAMLAVDQDELSAVKQQAYVLLGSSSDSSDYWPTRVLQCLGDALNDDLGFLAGQSWAPRSLAAVLWSRHPVPQHLGRRLARDEDPRVRRTLATELAQITPQPEHAEALQILQTDPAFSVRSLLHPRA